VRLLMSWLITLPNAAPSEAAASVPTLARAMPADNCHGLALTEEGQKRIKCQLCFGVVEFGAPEEIRTPDPQIRRQGEMSKDAPE